MSNKVTDYLDQILKKYSEGTYYEEVKRARDEFFKKVGKVAEASDLYDRHMKAFIDWYIFDRPLDKFECTPVLMFLREMGSTLNSHDREIYEQISKNNHSLFEFIKEKNSDVHVKDLFDGEIYLVEESEIHMGFTKKDIFETRLIQFGDKLVFGNSFLFHPQDCRSYITKQIKKIKNLDLSHRMKLMQKLALLKLKADQYPHVDVKDIYSEAKLFEAH